MILYPAPMGAITQLWGGLAAETADYNGKVRFMRRSSVWTCDADDGRGAVLGAVGARRAGAGQVGRRAARGEAVDVVRGAVQGLLGVSAACWGPCFFSLTVYYTNRCSGYHSCYKNGCRIKLYRIFYAVRCASNASLREQSRTATFFLVSNHGHVKLQRNTFVLKPLYRKPLGLESAK